MLIINANATGQPLKWLVHKRHFGQQNIQFNKRYATMCDSTEA